MARKKALKLATFNVNGLNARLPNLLDCLVQEKPDIVAFQELKATDPSFPVSSLERAGYGSFHRPRPAVVEQGGPAGM